MGSHSRLRRVLVQSTITLVAVLSGRAWAAAGDSADTADRTLSPYFLVEGGGDGVDVFPLEATDVVANVSGVIADVTVRQTYKNGGKLPLNARYVFPASTRAAVHGMEIAVGDRRVVARIKERQQAAKEFEAAKQQGKTASLLEEERPNVFTMSIANVLPNDRVVVELHYSELLVPEEGVYEFVYPTVVGPRYSKLKASSGESWIASPYLHMGTTPPTSFTLKTNVSAGLPVADLFSPSHELKVDWEGKTVAHVTLAPSTAFAGNHDFVLRYRLTGNQIQSGVLLHHDPKEDLFLLMVQPPARVAQADIPPREYVFVLDVSGSMIGFPLDTAKRLMRDLLGGLRPTDSFDVVLFSGASRTYAPRSVPASRDEVQRALAFIDHEHGGGGTELEAALGMVAKIPHRDQASRAVVVVTDGYIAEERGAFDLVAKNLHDTNVFAFGIGSSVNRHLIEGVARAGQGEPFVVLGPHEAPAVAARFRRYIESPVLTHVQVEYPGLDAYDVEPAAEPDLFAERPIVVFGKLRGSRRGQIVVTGRTATGTFRKAFDLGGIAPRPEHAALPQLWARTRIARLSDFATEDSEDAREVTNLGLSYSLLTRYTSFIAVVEQVRARPGSSVDVAQPLPLPAGVEDSAVGDYTSGAEPELWLLVALGAVIVAVMYVRRRRRSQASC
jgi:Ca-activated chloride channel family protein